MATNDIFAGSTNPYLQAAQATSQGNLAGAQQATAANRVNQATPYANLNYQQTGTDAQGNPIWSATQTLAQPFQQTLGNIQGQLQQATASPFDVSQFKAGQVGQGPQLQTGVSGTGMEGWDKATQLINQRLQPQIQQSEDRLKAQLANQGIAPGTEAYNRALTQQGQKTNDLLTQAQLAGSQVQNTMFGQNVAAGQFGNQALQSQYANQLAGTQANNAAQQQNYQQALTARNLPLQQLGAFQQATQPGYVNPYTQAAVSGPDYLGAYSTGNAAQIAAQNAANAKTAGTTAGLYGLGSAALIGGGGLSGLTTGLTGLAGLGKSAYDWLNSASPMDNSPYYADFANNGWLNQSNIGTDTMGFGSDALGF